MFHILEFGDTFRLRRHQILKRQLMMTASEREHSCVACRSRDESDGLRRSAPGGSVFLNGQLPERPNGAALFVFLLT